MSIIFLGLKIKMDASVILSAMYDDLSINCQLSNYSTDIEMDQNSYVFKSSN